MSGLATAPGRRPPQPGPPAPHGHSRSAAAAAFPALLVSALLMVSCVGGGPVREAALAPGPAALAEHARPEAGGFSADISPSAADSARAGGGRDACA